MAFSSTRPLPETETWTPRNASQTLVASFAETCKAAEQQLLSGLEHEKKLTVDNFDSGAPFENLVRNEISRLLPKRYSASSGLVLDRQGKTAGKCDIVIFNDVWFTPVKPTEGTGSSPYFPVEGVYAVGEIKQTLSSSTLDEAMEKLVKCHRLERPRTYAHRIVENREGPQCSHGLTNPLFSFLLAGGVAPGESLQNLIERFFDISKQLKRLEVVRALCVLGQGAVVWAFRDPFRGDEIRSTLFVEDDLFHPIFPVFSPVTHRSPFLLLLQTLQQSLFHTILGPEDSAFAYGLDANGIRVPTDLSICLEVEKEWTELLQSPCHHNP